MSNPLTLVGSWTYRSFLNNPDLSADFASLEFGRANLKINLDQEGTIKGTIGDTGWSLDVTGNRLPTNPLSISFRGQGIVNGETWIYDYLGYLIPMWSDGINQIPVLVGSIVRVVTHSNGQAQAGEVASWIAVHQ